MGKGEDFNKRVWTLFSKAGFETKPNTLNLAEHKVYLSSEDTDGRPLDLYAHDPELNVTVIASNKARKKLKSYTAHIHDFAKLKEAAKADAAVFIASEKKMQPKERRFALKNGVHVWDERELTYYEAVANAIEQYAKYEICKCLQVNAKQEKYRQLVPALRLEQPNLTSPTRTQLFLFVLPAEKLLPLAIVLRRARGHAFAYQRIISKGRLPEIAAFVQAPDALLPTAIILHLSDKVRVHDLSQTFRDTNGLEVAPDLSDAKLVELEIPNEFASMEIIDGQHRLYAFARTSPTTRRLFHLPIVGLLNLDDQRRSTTFVDINDKAKRVDANLRAILRYTDSEKICKQDPELMAIKIAVELNKKPPLEDAIRLFDMGPQVLTLKGVSGYDLKGLIADNGLLRRCYPSNRTGSYVRVLRQYFKLISTIFSQEWKDPKHYLVATNRGFTAFLKLLRSMLRTEKKKLSVAVMRKYLKALDDQWDTWETAKLKKSYVGSQGWAQLHADMVEKVRKTFPKFDV